MEPFENTNCMQAKVKKCEHGREKSRCKECGGVGICEHGKRKSRCKECGGASICEHGREKSTCKRCGGSAICEHGKIKSQCKECGGASICEHGRQKSQCKECGGASICEHGRQKSYCKECGGVGICEHGKRKFRCKECGGMGICEHGKIKSHCKECGGSQICEHGKLKQCCKKCGGSALCKSEWCETTKNRKYNGYCMYCFMHLFPDEKVARNYKTKETTVVHHVQERFPVIDWACDKTIQGGCSRRRPDMLADLGSHIIIIEIDEHKHDEYECICENRRIMEISQDLGHRPVVFIRFNPDAYVGLDGTKVTSPWRSNGAGVMQIAKKRQKEWDERLAALDEMTGYWLTRTPERMVETVELFY